MATVRETEQSPGDEAWTILRGFLLDGRRRFLAAASALDLHPAQAGALLQMEPDAAMPMHELATMLACDNSNVTGIVDRLEARGLVARRPYAQDRRVKHVGLTPAGVELRDRIRAQLAEPPDAIRRLSPSDQRLLRDVLRRATRSPAEPAVAGARGRGRRRSGRSRDAA
ncbi:MAG TPA: MarR family transcriptional regulator [Solirubrobacteraceae bacterium]|nr:MarR family transcriptional regulator [Solirubrobacteraceae bacterium]